MTESILEPAGTVAIFAVLAAIGSLLELRRRARELPELDEGCDESDPFVRVEPSHFIDGERLGWF